MTVLFGAPIAPITGVSTRLRRFPHFSYRGFYRYSLTFCAFDRKPIFVDAFLVESLVAQILRAATDCRFAVLAYCFMPDHVHLLVEGGDNASHLSLFVKRAKQRSGYHGRRLTGEPIWQSGYFERVLRESDDARQVAAYIVANPVRAGLAEEPGAYPFIGSEICSTAELLEFVRSE